MNVQRVVKSFPVFSNPSAVPELSASVMPKVWHSLKFIVKC